MQAAGARRATAAGIVGALLCVWLVGVLALAQFVDVAAAVSRRAPARGEPPGLPPLPERVTALPESVEQLRAMLAARARPRPDARFLLAVADVHRAHRGTAAVVTTRFDGGRWTVLHGNTVVGTLPESPSFSDARELLAAWSRSLERPPPRRVRGELPPDAVGWALLAPGARVVPALDRLGALWTLGARSPELRAGSARASAALAVATPAAAELADAVEARALAALALAADVELPDVAALVAWRLGYRREARALAAALPEAHPVRAALAASAPPATATLPEALASLEAESGARAEPAEEGVCLAHASALAAGRTPNGPFVDRDLLARRDASVLGAAILRELSARLRAHGPRAAGAYVTVVDREAPEALRPLLAWAARVARVAADDERAETLLGPLAPSSPTPPALLACAARMLAAGVSRDNPRRQQSHDFLATHLDSRPAHLALRAEAARRDAADHALARSLCAEVARARGEDDPACGAAPDDVFAPPSATTAASDAADHWRARRPRDAARAVARRAAVHADDRAESLARAFAAAVGPREVAPAVRAMTEAGVDFELQAALGDALGRQGHEALALAALDAVEAPDPLAAADLQLRAWRVRRGAHGEAAADAWLRGAVPSARRGAAAVAAYRHGAFGALWSVASPDVDDVAHREYIWLLRAMASVRSGPNDPRRTTATTHFLGDETNEYAVIGRCVLGRAAPRDVLALAESEPLRALSLYALGVRAEGEGRRAEAADWYQLARLAGAPDERETRWAAERLDALAEAPP
ncbi:MAG: hypothetical protein U0324_45965 [Polyangiales bacterium]